jgi:site-specific DNA-cytosine methylase
MPFNIKHLPGHHNGIADLLSRTDPSECDGGILRIVDLYAGSHSLLGAITWLHQRFVHFSSIDYQCIERDADSREIIQQNYYRAIRAKVPLTGDPFELSRKVDHDVAKLTQLIGSPEDTNNIWQDIRETLSQAHLVIGGPPCQGHSTANKKRQLSKDERNGWPSILSLRWCIKGQYFFENVPGILDDKPLIDQLDHVLGPHHKAKLLGAQQRERVYWTSLPTTDYSDLIRQKTEIPLTWQQALDVAKTKATVLSNQTFSPTLMATQGSYNETKGAFNVLDADGKTQRLMTMEEKEALVGLTPHTTVKSMTFPKQTRSTVKQRILGNAIPVAEHVQILLRTLGQSTTVCNNMSHKDYVNGRERPKNSSMNTPQIPSPLLLLPQVTEESNVIMPLQALTEVYNQMKELHEKEGHPGIARIVQLYRNNFGKNVAPSLLKAVAKDVLIDCSFCTSMRPESNSVEPRSTLPLPTKLQPWSEAQVDEILQLPSSNQTDANGNSYNAIEVIIDRFSGFCMAFPISSKMTAQECAEQTWDKFQQRGIPSKLYLDRGSRYHGNYRQFMEKKNVLCQYCAARRHITQGEVETANNSLQYILKSLVLGGGHDVRDWPMYLQPATRIMNDHPRAGLRDFSASELVQGYRLASSAQHPDLCERYSAWYKFARDLVKQKQANNQALATEYNLKHRVFQKEHLKPGQQVFVKNDNPVKSKMEPNFKPDPYTVVTFDELTRSTFCLLM